MENNAFVKNTVATFLHQIAVIAMLAGLYGIDYFDGTDKFGLKIFMIAIAAGGFCLAFVMMWYLANAISSFHAFDKIGADVQFVLFAVICYLVLKITLPVETSYTFADRMVAVGVVGYLLDVLFLLFYASAITQFKEKTIVQNSLTSRLLSLVMGVLFEHTMFTRALRALAAWVLGFFGAALFFLEGSYWGILLVMMSLGIELFFSLQKASEERKIRLAIMQITEGNLDVELVWEDFHGEQKKMAQAVNHIRDGLSLAVREGIKNERMKADLITNVSHDLKTPLTSIINYVELLKRVIPETDVARQHLRVLDEKSQRMKTLLENLVEVSRLTSGTVKYEISRIDFVEFLYEIGAELDERFENRGLTIETKLPRLPVYIEADGRQLCRAIENLYTNAAKYAKEHTHIYVELKQCEEQVVFSIRNVMERIPDIDKNYGEDLTERFVRGDKARTTEGSGLGLSITKELITQMGGLFCVMVEEDTYIAQITFKIS